MNNIRFCILGFAVFLLFSCGASPNYIRRIQALEEGVSNPTTIEELKDAIDKYEKRVEDIVGAQSQTGIWYKILATRYIDKAMYGEALDALRAAIQYYPSNQNLFYYVGVCAGYMAKSTLDFGEGDCKADRERYLGLAESGYKRALEIQPDYSRAMYGLGVLYTFEMNQPEKAVPLLENFLTIQTKDTSGMFVLARAYYMTGRYDEAVSTYDKIIETTKVEEQKKDAMENKELILASLYGEN